MRLGLLAVVALAGCYQAPQSDESCTITCTEGVADNCPGDLVCDGGYCVGPGQICRPTFVQTTAGTGFACSIDDAGALWCWGKLTGTTQATRVDTTHHWDSIDAGGGQICGIADEQLFCWGENDDREVSGTVVGDVAEPLQIQAMGIERWRQVSAGLDYTCAVGEGQLVCWGENYYGQLGDGTTMDRGVPTPVAAGITDWVAVAAGENHSCAISTTYGVHCFGRNIRDELGVNGGTGSLIPVSVTMGGTALNATSIAVASYASCAIGTDATPYCWGYNGNGTLGDKRLVDPATIAQTAEPVRASDVAGFTKIVGAHHEFCALAADAVYCWGGADSGGIGAGIWTDYLVFQKPIAAGATDVSLGQPANIQWGYAYYDFDLGCAIVDGNTQCWGDNRYGQLGHGTATMTTTPTEVAGNHRFTEISAGLEHACGIGDDATLYCWGSTERGQATGFIYGGGTTRMPCAPNPTDPTEPLCDVGEPRAISYAPNPSAVATGTAHTCALSNGVASCWGNGLINGALKRDLNQPAAAMWKTLVHTGRDAQCGTAEMAGDPVYCVGAIFNATSAPTRMAQLDGFKSIQLGGYSAGYAVFLDASGLLQGAGDNSYYEMGDGTNTNYPAVMAIGTRTYTAISTRASDTNRETAYFVCGIRATDQKVECWGQASRGQTGATDTTVDTMTPNEVPNLSACTAIANGGEHACAVCDGGVYCWGDNRNSQLAAMQTDVVSSIPRKVDIPLTGESWVQLVAGRHFTCARSESGRVFCWGLSERGALGNGSTGSNLPMTVLASQVD